MWGLQGVRGKLGRALAPNHAEGVYISSDRRSVYHQHEVLYIIKPQGDARYPRDEIQGRLAALQLVDKVYFKNGSCYFAQIKFYKKDSATEQKAPSGRELSSEARLKEPAGDYTTILTKTLLSMLAGSFHHLRWSPSLPEGGHITIAFVHFAKYNSKILLCHQPEGRLAALDDMHRTSRGDDMPSLREPPKLVKLASGNPYAAWIKKSSFRRTRIFCQEGDRKDIFVVP